ncbi:MAG: hypothetical protein OEV45_16020, partial [Desulfobacteraceae bacterium]|nr:hypothetical protein [Desulfobacteraceae bacterium]
MYLCIKLSPFETLRDCRFLSASGGLPDLLCCMALAVAYYSSAPCALHLRQTRQSFNLGIR